MSVGDMLESKRIVITIAIFNALLFFSLIVYFFVQYHDLVGASAPEQIAEDETVADSDNELMDIYMNLFRGKRYDLGDGVVFDFGTDDSFSGFFDGKNTSVDGYHYTCTMEDFGICLNIYNADETEKISWIIDFDEDGLVTLTYPESDQTLTLAN